MINGVKCCYIRCSGDSTLDAMWRSLAMTLTMSSIVEVISDLDKNGASVVGAESDQEEGNWRQKV